MQQALYEEPGGVLGIHRTTVPLECHQHFVPRRLELAPQGDDGRVRVARPTGRLIVRDASVDNAPCGVGDGRRQLVMLHGWGQSSSDWMPVAELLAPHATIHVVDLPGFGASEAPDPRWGTKECAEVVSDHLGEVGVESATLVGHSFGARIALRIANARPRMVRSLALVSAAGLPGARPIGARVKLQALSTLRRAASLAKRDVVPVDHGIRLVGCVKSLARGIGLGP